MAPSKMIYDVPEDSLQILQHPKPRFKADYSADVVSIDCLPVVFSLPDAAPWHKINAL